MMRNEASPLPDTEVHYLRSEHVGDEFKVIIGHSGSANAGSRPVLVLGDPWANFGTAVETARLLRLSGAFPDLVVVGVGYRATAIEDISTLRTRDFTPTVDPGRATETVPETIMGGADRFLGFLRDELAPWLRGRHGADPDDAMLFGDSYGGLFAAYVLLTEPATFGRYGIGSPSLWWDHDVLFRHEAEYARTHSDLAARVFISVGALETPAGRARYLDQLDPERRAQDEAEDADDPPVDMVEYMERLVGLLRGRAYPSLEIDSAVFPDEYHETAPALNLSRALRFGFGAPR